jgi:hypothetical protein
VPTASFSSLEQCEIVEVAFLAPDGEELRLPLLVDSGFTGQSGFVLSTDVERLAHAAVPASQAAGALSGMQKRVVVRWRISGLSMERLAIAILADISPLALPTGIQGLAGLRFLRCFSRWGAEQAASGRWHFELSTDSVSST